jgi:hypothetical protein
LKYKLKFPTQINLSSQKLSLLIKHVNLKRLKIFEENSVDTKEVSSFFCLPIKCDVIEIINMKYLSGFAHTFM